MGDTIVNVLHQMKEASHATGNMVENVQILLEAIDEYKLKLATVSKEGEGKLHLCTDEWGRGRWRNNRRLIIITIRVA